MSTTSWPFPINRAAERAVDVTCVGDALVDRLVGAPADAPAAAGLESGAMTLVDAAAARTIEASREDWREVAGGSAANTAVGIASFGGRPAFAGAVGDDAAGRSYEQNLESSGVRAFTPPVSNALPTGICHVFVDPDGTRTMATHLGAAAHVGPEVADAAPIAESLVLYVEGYLLDAPDATKALERAFEIAKSAGTLVALTLSDPFVVDRHRDRILEMIGDGTVDVVFGNEEEARSLTGASSTQEAVDRLVRPGLAIFVTRGAEGSTVVTADGSSERAADPVASVEDTTGAGDLFAAGVLFAMANGDSPERALELGSLAAAEVIGHLGARPLTPLSTLVKDRPPS